MVGMLNQVSLAKTGKTLGFVSPLLYQMHADDPTIFQDITVGDNKCTEQGCNPFCYGYLCTTGWDRTLWSAVAVSTVWLHLCAIVLIVLEIVMRFSIRSRHCLTRVFCVDCACAAVTGLGSLNYGKAEAYLINMFDRRATQ
jgi:hypothetical protein